MIKSIWNKDCIKNIQVTLAERLGVEARGGYYDASGAMRDMVQNHIFQIITLLAMPEPASLADTDIHAAKEALLDSLEIPDEAEVAAGFVRATTMLPVPCATWPVRRHRDYFCLHQRAQR